MKVLVQQAKRDLRPVFERLEETELHNLQKVQAAFEALRIAQRHFAPSEGYGYDDVGRDTLEKLYAHVFNAEAAIVRPQLTSGTHTLSLCLFGLLLPGEHLLSAAGEPYDTMQTVIGKKGDGIPGTLHELGVTFSSVPMKEDRVDEEAVLQNLRPNTRVALIQRSRGYSWRKALTLKEIESLIQKIKAVRPDIYIMVDNCYGEFTQKLEPSDLGADVVAGSLIKNPGGGLASTGGYIVGAEKAIGRIESRLTAPGIGRETGSYQGGYRLFYQGLFMAPHTVCQALKTAALAAKMAENLGFETSPASDSDRDDIIQAIQFGDRDKLIAFCQGIQYASPVDAFVTPEPWAMPGYQDEVIMAAGAFVPGASIELSCDAPMRPPYTAYLQGGLCLSHGMLALERAFSKVTT
jgi:cystathionine beta-lyase family protein involved in aluminum resistance